METGRDPQPVHDSRPAVSTLSVVALTVATAAAVLLTAAERVWTGTSADEAVPTGLFLLGWAVLALAVVLCGACLARALARFRSLPGREHLLVAAGVALVVVTCLLHPAFGSGGGSG